MLFFFYSLSLFHTLCRSQHSLCFCSLFCNPILSLNLSSFHSPCLSFPPIQSFFGTLLFPVSSNSSLTFLSLLKFLSLSKIFSHSPASSLFSTLLSLFLPPVQPLFFLLLRHTLFSLSLHFAIFPSFVVAKLLVQLLSLALKILSFASPHFRHSLSHFHLPFVCSFCSPHRSPTFFSSLFPSISLHLTLCFFSRYLSLLRFPLPSHLFLSFSSRFFR